MGVRGLQTFFKYNTTKFATKENISETHLVINANNIFSILYKVSTGDRCSPGYRNDVYGGDMVRYGQIVKEFFAALDKCKITPVLVFDGAVSGKLALRETVAYKEQESRRKGQEEFDRAKKSGEVPFAKEVAIPLNLNFIFRYLASECGARIIQAPYEADSHIARIANELHCPVLSNDSNFLFYSLERGFILLDSFDYKKPHAEGGDGDNFYIEATIISQDNLARSVPSFRLEVLPLLSVLLGNEFVETSVFTQFVNTICKKSYRGQYFATSFNHKRIANMLDWLAGKSLYEAIELILRPLKRDNRDQYRELIDKLMRNFQIEGKDDFDKELECVYPPERVVSALHKAPAQFLRHHMEKNDLNSIVLYMILKNTQYNYKVIDDFSLPSSTEVSFKPISLALALLRASSYENLTEGERRYKAREESFSFYDRKDGQYAEFVLKPMETLEGFGSLDHLDCYSMIALDTDTKLKLLMACFRTTAEDQKSITDTLTQVFSGPFIEQASLCFLLIKYIGLESELAPSPQFVNALMLTLVYHAIKAEQLSEKLVPQSELFDQLLGHLNPLSVKNAGMYGGARDQSMYRKISHFISQLQVALKSYGLVNTLLGHPYHRPRQELYFNGVLIYSVTKMLLTGEKTIESICGDLPLVIDVCDSLQAQVRDRSG